MYKKAVYPRLKKIPNDLEKDLSSICVLSLRSKFTGHSKRSLQTFRPIPLTAVIDLIDLVTGVIVAAGIEDRMSKTWMSKT